MISQGGKEGRGGKVGLEQGGGGAEGEEEAEGEHTQRETPANCHARMQDAPHLALREAFGVALSDAFLASRKLLSLATTA